MNAHRKEFGDAVHEALSHFNKYGPSEEGLMELADQLFEGTRISVEDEAHIMEIWKYLAEIVRIGSITKFEVKVPNGRVPDMMVRHGAFVYLIEVKTMSKGSLDILRNDQERQIHILSQSLAAARSVERKFPHTQGKIKPYVLMFRRDLKWGEYEPEWVDLTPHMDYEG